MSTHFAPDRRDELKAPGQEQRDGADRRRFLRPTTGLRKMGLIYAAIFFAVLCAIAALVNL